MEKKEIPLSRKIKLFINKRSPSQLMLFSYAAVILIGALLLYMPFSSRIKKVSFIDALFTATSAVCVTGLTVLDTGKDFSRIGQIMILLLIQVGGLGIMTLSSFFLFVFGKNISIKSKRALRETFDQLSLLGWKILLLSIFVFTLIIESIGAIFLYRIWGKEYPSEKALFLSIFHSISAFCNAGFSLFSDSFNKYFNNLGVNVIICSLIVLGGIGFFVVNEIIYKLIRRRFSFKLLTLHSKLVISTTLLLIILGAGLIYFFELYNTLEFLTLKEKILVAFFQSITARTAGFNTIDIGKLSGCSLIILIVMMFIGGSPGSTAGGIKTTTAAILYAIAKSKIKGSDKVFIFSRTIPKDVIEKAITISVVSLVFISFVSLLIYFSEYPYMPVEASGSFYLKSLFESVSAFGTVGLSTGITSKLNDFSKILIIILMYIGRLGPLTIAIAFGSREVKSRIEFAEENVMVG